MISGLNKQSPRPLQRLNNKGKSKLNWYVLYLAKGTGSPTFRVESIHNSKEKLKAHIRTWKKLLPEEYRKGLLAFRIEVLYSTGEREYEDPSDYNIPWENQG